MLFIGTKETVIVQLPPGDTCDPQLLVWLKETIFGLIIICAILSVCVPMFVSFVVSLLDVLTVPKLSTLGSNWTAGPVADTESTTRTDVGSTAD